MKAHGIIGWLLLAVLAAIPQASAAPPASDRFAQIRALREAAKFLEDRLSAPCAGTEAMEIAERIAGHHRTILDLFMEEPAPRSEGDLAKLVTLAREFTDSSLRAHACEPGSERALVEAKAVIGQVIERIPTELESVYADAKSLHQRLEEAPPRHQPPPPPPPPPSNVKIVYDGEVIPDAPSHGSVLRNLALRFEGGVAAVCSDEDNGERCYQPGGYLRLSTLARFGERVRFLFGPYFGHTRVDRHKRGREAYSSFGAHVEIEIPLSRRHDGLSLNLSVFLGLEKTIFKAPKPSYMNPHGGAAIHLCFARRILCPTLRVSSMPALEWELRPMVQIGLGFDFIRLAEAVRASQ